MRRGRSRFELERMKVAGSCSGDGELGLRPAFSQGVYMGGTFIKTMAGVSSTKGEGSRERG